jgi:hypothetical protein
MVDGHHVVIRYGDGNESKQQSTDRPASKDGASKDKTNSRQNQKRGSKDSITTAESKDGNSRRRRTSADRDNKSRTNGLSVDTAAPAKERSRSREPASRSPSNRRDSGSNLESKHNKRNTASTRASDLDPFMRELNRLSQEKATQEVWQQTKSGGQAPQDFVPLAQNPFSPADLAHAGMGMDFPPGLAPPMMGLPPMYYASFAAAMGRDPLAFAYGMPFPPFGFPPHAAPGHPFGFPGADFMGAGGAPFFPPPPFMGVPPGFDPGMLAAMEAAAGVQAAQAQAQAQAQSLPADIPPVPQHPPPKAVDKPSAQ